MGRRLRAAAGWMMLCALVFAPWAVGCVQPWAVQDLTLITLTAGLTWAIGCIVQRRPPVIPRVIIICTTLLLAQGWWMILNAHGDYHSGGYILQKTSLWPGGAGAVDADICMAMMWQITAILVSLAVACDLMPRLVWRWRFVNTIGWTGVSIAAYGLLQKAGVVPILAERGFQESVFGTYDYHGNAGAFLNLAIPALFAMAARNRSPAPIAGLFLCLAASLANISRAGMVIAILVLIAMVFMTGLFLTRQLRRRVLIGILIAVIVATAAGGGAAWRRWQTFDGLNNPRLLMLQLAAPMAIDAGFFGDGPGSFKLLYFNSPHLPGALYSRWRVTIFRPGEETDVNSYVHNDYLQFIIEWGFLGGLLWAILLGSTMTLGIAAFRRAITREERLILAAALIAAAGVLAHSLVDWPLQVASLQLYTAIYLALLLQRGRALRTED